MAETKNPMQEIRLEKVVLNIGIGANEQLFPNAKALLKKLTGKEAIGTRSKRRDPSLNLTKGKIIGAMVTLRGKDAVELLKRALDANNNVIKGSAVTDNTLNFGINEYIDFSGVKYDAKIGMLGMNVNALFGRKGKRVEVRKRKRSSSDKKHSTVTKEEILDYLAKNFNAGVKTE